MKRTDETRTLLPEPAEAPPVEVVTDAAPPPTQAIATKGKRAMAVGNPENGLNKKTVTMFERLARDPNVPVEKLEKLIGLQERVLDREARMAFDRDFSAMQDDLPNVAKTREGDNGKWLFASLDDVLRAVRPAMAKHGFSHRWSTVFEGDFIIVTCHLSHREGHSETSQFRANADKTGSKNSIQAAGSTVQYARRYSLLDVLGVSTGTDDDGASSERDDEELPDAPSGWEDWAISLETVAEDGMDRLLSAWRQSKDAFRNHMMAVHRNKWERIKQAAMRSDKQAGRRSAAAQGGGR